MMANDNNNPTSESGNVGSQFTPINARWLKKSGGPENAQQDKASGPSSRSSIPDFKESPEVSMPNRTKDRIVDHDMIIATAEGLVERIEAARRQQNEVRKAMKRAQREAAKEAKLSRVATRKCTPQKAASKKTNVVKSLVDADEVSGRPREQTKLASFFAPIDGAVQTAGTEYGEDADLVVMNEHSKPPTDQRKRKFNDGEAGTARQKRKVC